MDELSKLQIWLLAIRPKTLPAAVGPVIVGTAFAINLSHFRIFPALAALIGALLLQIIANLANDYFDYIKGHDTDERIGPTRVIASGMINLKEMKIGLMVSLTILVIDGLYLIYEGGVIILIIGLFSIVFAILYSGGPLPLASNALGDLFVFIFFGLVAVNGTYFVQAGTFVSHVFLGSIPIGLLITAILVVNNHRDMDTDSKTGKLTTSILFGKKGSQYYYLSLLILAYLVPILLLILYPEFYSYYVLLPLISIPLAFNPVRDILSDSLGPELNQTLADTARLSLIYSLLFAIGITL